MRVGKRWRRMPDARFKVISDAWIKAWRLDVYLYLTHTGTHSNLF